MMTEEVNKLQRVSYQLLVANLQAYGNVLNTPHEKALEGIVNWMVNMLSGRIKGRHVFDLSTGGGKTQAIVATLAAAHMLGYLEQGKVTVAVCAFKVEALCDLKRDLVMSRIPEELIGLQHTYSYDPKEAEAVRNGKPLELRSNHATEPATTDNDSRPILLCTHNLVKSDANTDRYNIYKGEPRRLLVWDEAMSKSEAFNISISGLEEAYGWLGGKARCDSRASLQASAEYIGQCMDIVREGLAKAEEAKKATDGVGAPVEVNLPELDAPAIRRLKHGIPPEGRPAAAQTLDALLDISQQPLRVMPGSGRNRGVIGYQLAVDSKLENIIVLNASHSIDKVQLSDNNLKTPSWYKGVVVDYSQVKVNVIKHAAGRDSIEKAFQLKDKSDLLNEYVDIVKLMPEDEGVLVFTFKPKDKIDCKDILTKRLNAAGIDTDAKVEVMTSRGMENKNRFVWLTHGNETSISKYSYCKNELWCGVMYKSEAVVASELCGAADDLRMELNPDELEKAIESQIATCYHQGFARGACRTLDYGQAKATTIWATYKHSRLKPLEVVKKVMPGIKLVPWKAKHVGKPTKEEAAAEAVVNYLSQLSAETPEGVKTKISVAKVKSELGLEKFKGPGWVKSRDIAIDTLQWTWMLQGRSFTMI